MDIKTIKKGISMTELIFGLILTMGIFMALFSWVSYNATNSGLPVNSSYNEIFSEINKSQNKLSINVEDVKNKAGNISEADNTWQVAWNGLLGIGSVTKAFFSFLSTALHTMNTLIVAISFTPSWFKILLTIGITALLILLIIALFRGESRI